MSATHAIAGSSARILVVDDDTEILHVIRGALEDEGLSVDTAHDGAQALAVAEQCKPDLAVVDMTLPMLSGASVVSSLRKRRGDSFPVLVITADGHAAMKAREVGAYAYLRKPFDLNELVTEVQRGLARISSDQ